MNINSSTITQAIIATILIGIVLLLMVVGISTLVVTVKNYKKASLYSRKIPAPQRLTSVARCLECGLEILAKNHREAAKGYAAHYERQHRADHDRRRGITNGR